MLLSDNNISTCKMSLILMALSTCKKSIILMALSNYKIIFWGRHDTWGGTYLPKKMSFRCEEDLIIFIDEYYDPIFLHPSCIHV
jgi:hypothetical protein